MAMLKAGYLKDAKAERFGQIRGPTTTVLVGFVQPKQGAPLPRGADGSASTPAEFATLPFQSPKTARVAEVGPKAGSC
jgi:hypothetical protein